MSEINSYSEKSAPESTDEILIQETSGGAYKKIQYGNGPTSYTLTSTDAGATAGPALVLYRNSASPADDDIGGKIDFDGEDDGDNQLTYARIQVQLKDVSDGTEDGEIEFHCQAAGTLTDVMRLSGTAFGVDVASTFASSVTIDGQGGVGNASGLHLTHSKDDAFVGPVLSIERDSASPADDDIIGAVEFVGKNDAGTPEDIIYADITGQIKDFTDGTEDGGLLFRAVSNNTEHTELMAVTTSGVTLGSPTSGFMGIDTLNATAVYDDGSILSDYVFDAEIDGDVDAEKYDSRVPDKEDREGRVIEVRQHIPAREFKQSGMSELDPAAYVAKWKATRKLPALDRLEQRVGSKAGLGETIQALVETCEVQAVHIAKQQDEIDALKSRIAALESV